MIFRIPVLKKGEEYAPFYALIDEDDYELLNQFTWRAIIHPRSRTIYAKMCDRKAKKLGLPSARMHKILTGYNQTDHINGVGLDNRRENLRKTNTSQNHANQPKRRGVYSSQYKGVSLHKHSGLWKAEIGAKGYIGYFKTEEEAARAYDVKAKELFGEFARTNF